MTSLFKTVLLLTSTSIYAQTLHSRLSGGSQDEARYEGRLEVFHKNRWRNVCDRAFGDAEARVVCFSLGFPRHCGRAVSNSFGPSSVDRHVLRADIRCSGSEQSLGGCSYRRRLSTDDVKLRHHCAQSSNHVAVSCRQCQPQPAAARRVRRNLIIPPHNTHPPMSDDGGVGRGSFWMGGLFILFFFSWVLIVMCCIICNCYHRRQSRTQNGAQAASQGVFMTPLSGVDNAALSNDQDIALPLSGLPSYDDVIANSDKYKRLDVESYLPSYSSAVVSQQSVSREDENDRT